MFIWISYGSQQWNSQECTQRFKFHRVASLQICLSMADARAQLMALLPQLLDTDDSSSSDSDDEVALMRPAVIPRDLPKSRHYFTLIDEMDEEEFRSHFRLSWGQ